MSLRPVATRGREVTLVCANGSQLVIPMDKEVRDFTYAGRLWSYNKPFSDQMQRATYCEINEWVVNDMRQQACAVLEMSDRFEAQLQRLAKEADGPAGDVQ